MTVDEGSRHALLRIISGISEEAGKEPPHNPITAQENDSLLVRLTEFQIEQQVPYLIVQLAFTELEYFSIGKLVVKPLIVILNRIR